MEPVGEQGFFASLGHTGNGEVVFLARKQADSVFVDRADFAECDLHASVGVVGAVEDEAAGVQGQLA